MPGRDLRHEQRADRPRGELDDDGREVFGGDVDVRGALLVHGAGRGVEPHDAVARHELDEVDQVRPDVGERPRRPAERGVDPPVVVVRGREPVLQVGAVHAEESTGVAAGRAGPRLARHRVEPVDEGHGRDEAALGGQVDERQGVGRRGREGLLADHVLARLECGAGDLGVRGVGRADVHDVDVGIGDQRLDGVEGGVEAEPVGGVASADRGGGRTARELGACGPSGPGVHGGHEAAADEAGAKRAGRGDDVRCHGRHADTGSPTFASASTKAV